jgi:hypothetical protein
LALATAIAMNTPVSLRRDAIVARAPECRRNVDSISTVVDTANNVNGDAAMTYGIVGFGLAWSTCRMINHYAHTGLMCLELPVVVGALTYGAVFAAS